MRVLWFSHLPTEAMNHRFNRGSKNSGFWTDTLIEPLVQSGEAELAVATATAGLPRASFRERDVDYFNIPQNKVLEVFGIGRSHRLSRYLSEAAAVIDSWKPDLIHVHGTERFFGLVRTRGLTTIPTVVSIQGLIEQCVRWSLGAMSWREALMNTTVWELSRNATLLAEQHRYNRQIPLEREILRGVDAVIGRTAWDQSHVRQVNPGVRYFHVDETLRPQFWSVQAWNMASAQRGVVMTTSSAAPLKGLPVLLRAIAILRGWGHDVKLKVGGLSRRVDRRGSAKYVFKLIRQLKLDDAVELLGWLDAGQLAGHMRDAHCFVTPSFIENSSNAVCEAALIGMPVVATHTGGIPTMIHDERTGLLFSRGDEAMLACQIERVLRDEALAERLGKAAREEARRRHEQGKIVADLLNCYRQLAGRD